MKRDFESVQAVTEILTLYRSCVVAAFAKAGLPLDPTLIPSIPQSCRADALRRLFRVGYDLGRREQLEEEADDGK